MSNNSKRWMQGIAIITAVMPAMAWAHVGAGMGAHSTTGFLAGFSHPLSGLNHLLAMAAAVGVWAVPVAFVTLMLVGGVAGLAGLPLPYVELRITASLLVLGLLIAGACSMNVLAGMALVGFFAIFHGHAHGAEMSLASSAGFALATALLHGLGVGGVLLVRQRLMRLAGGAIAMSGVYLAYGSLYA